MTVFTGVDATQAIVDYLVTDGSKLSEPARVKIGSAVAGQDILLAIVTTMETLYSERVKHPLLEDLASFVSANNFYGLGGFDGRATKIQTVARRINEGGVAKKAGDLEDHPEYGLGVVAEEAPAAE
jgi:hypothetical protein